MLSGDTLPLYGDGSTRRDYTYVEDIVDGVMGAIHYDKTLYEVINLGHSRTISLLELVRLIEDALGLRANVRHLPEQPGDVPTTWADTSKAESLLGYAPRVPIEEGLARFASWLKSEWSPLSAQEKID